MNIKSAAGVAVSLTGGLLAAADEAKSEFDVHSITFWVAMGGLAAWLTTQHFRMGTWVQKLKTLEFAEKLRASEITALTATVNNMNLDISKKLESLITKMDDVRDSRDAIFDKMDRIDETMQKHGEDIAGLKVIRSK